jgi:hypothetical protein
MLERIPSRHRIEASEMLQLLTAYRRLGFGTLTMLVMSFAMERNSDLAYDSDIWRMSEAEVIRRGRRLQGRLAAICPGFFEVHRKAVTKPADPKHAPSLPAIHTRTTTHVREYDSWNGAAVEFLHKTAADFLHQDHIQYYLAKITSEEGFHPLRRLFESCVLRVKSLPCEYVLDTPFQ